MDSRMLALLLLPADRFCWLSRFIRAVNDIADVDAEDAADVGALYLFADAGTGVEMLPRAVAGVKLFVRPVLAEVNVVDGDGDNARRVALDTGVDCTLAPALAPAPAPACADSFMLHDLH